MERIQRALEIARRQQPGTAQTLVLFPPAAPPSPVPPTPALFPPPAASAPPVAAPPPPVAAPPPPVAPTLLRPAAVESAVRPPTLPRYVGDKAVWGERHVLLPDDPGPAARAYRMLRAQLLQRVRSANMRVFGIISALSGEGKTLTAINLALSLAAEPAHSVALIDFDLRHPGVGQTLGIEPAAGLDTWLNDTGPPASVLCELEEVPRLWIAPTLAPRGPSSVSLGGGRARELIEHLKTQDEHRLVVVDLPPALLTDDVLTISPLVDGFIFVVTESKTRREDVERVIELVGRPRIVGTVLNASSDSELRAY